MTIKYVVGDATDPPQDRPGIIVHICNDIGAWGKGFVVAVTRRWREPEAAFRAWSKGAGSLPFELGQVQFVAVEKALWVANIIGQHDIRQRGGEPPIRYDSVQQGLARVATKAVAEGAAVHMPRIGCGLAGGSWDKIEPMVQRELADKGVDVIVYDLTA